MLKNVSRGARWLDAGCGHQVFKFGSKLEESELVGRTSLAVGCDLSRSALQKHRSIRSRVCADLEQLPFADATFDVITLNYVAEHLEEPGRVFAEMGRLLRDEGRLVVCTPNATGYFVRLVRLGRRLIPHAWVEKFIRMRDLRGPEDVFPASYRANTRQQLELQARRSGMTEESCLLLRDLPLLYFFAPFAALEVLFIRLLTALGCRDLSATAILGVYRLDRGARQTGFQGGSSEQHAQSAQRMRLLT
jgi:SAM-dependent methyltransferase